jgi:hypothetical protein
MQSLISHFLLFLLPFMVTKINNLKTLIKEVGSVFGSYFVATFSKGLNEVRKGGVQRT